LLGIIHADEERPGKEINAADDEIPPIKFEEAVKFLEQKMPITKDEWKLLEPKARFRAFTVAKLGSATLIDTVKQQLLGVLEDGQGYAEFWNRIKQTVENDVSKIKPGYWETVFRTNTQSAYVAGKLQQFENSGVAAYQLMVIEDVRTSRICRNLLNKNSGYGIILPVKHPFWQKYGFPPYHFNCRSSIRGVWPSQVGKIGNVVENPTMKSLKIFKPQEDFGGNPLENDNWWRLTENQLEQAIKFNTLRDFKNQEKLTCEKISELKNNYIFLEEKVTKYALNPIHPRGRHKAKVFKSALGYTLDNYNELIDNVYRKVDKDLFENQDPNKYGKKYKQIINITGPNGRNADILTGWILEKNGKYRLTTIYVK
jgi:SPP1 gp7 family putative phage head morphogenesis protein